MTLTLLVALDHKTADDACDRLGLPRSTPRITARGGGWRKYASLLPDRVVWVASYDALKAPYAKVEKQARAMIRRAEQRRPGHVVDEASA